MTTQVPNLSGLFLSTNISIGMFSKTWKNSNLGSDGIWNITIRSVDIEKIGYISPICYELF